ncbi:MAG TPA: hypothetical protein VLH10_25625 [Yinghuangia sp.]|nr:hypothetical protein [Yinghuangia sp.]
MSSCGMAAVADGASAPVDRAADCLLGCFTADFADRFSASAGVCGAERAEERDEDRGDVRFEVPRVEAPRVEVRRGVGSEPRSGVRAAALFEARRGAAGAAFGSAVLGEVRFGVPEPDSGVSTAGAEAVAEAAGFPFRGRRARESAAPVLATGAGWGSGAPDPRRGARRGSSVASVRLRFCPMGPPCGPAGVDPTP